MKIKKYWIHLSSEDGEGSNSNFNIQFNNNIFSTLTPEDRIFIYPLRVSLPYSWDNVLPSAKFQVKLTTGTYKTISIPAGSPDSVYDLAEKIRDQLQAYNAGLDFGWDNYTKRFKFSWTSGLLSNISFLNEKATANLLGFPDLNKNVSTQTTYTAINPPDLTATTYIKILSNLSKRSFSIVNGVLGNSNVFMSMTTNNSSAGKNVVYENVNEEFLHEIDSSISNASFRVIDGVSGEELTGISSPVEIILGVIVEKHETTTKTELLQKINSLI